SSGDNCFWILIAWLTNRKGDSIDGGFKQDPKRPFQGKQLRFTVVNAVPLPLIRTISATRLEK
ncbi:MAG: hypothetical protein U5K27_13700, partial [Desulfotignum sp.]|nr:hypothetical protein [Desulfotignum sp.]